MIALAGTLEALLFLCADPVAADALAEAVGIDEDEAVEALEQLAASYEQDGNERVFQVLDELLSKAAAGLLKVSRRDTAEDDEP